MWAELAASAEVPSPAAFVECLEDPMTRSHIASAAALYRSLGVHGTPAFFTPDALLVGLLPAHELLSLLDTK